MITYNELREQAEAMDKKASACSHDYRVEGFSKIAHPETVYQIHPDHPSVTEGIVFSSYFCSICGNRVSVDEGREYMKARSKRGGLRNPPGGRPPKPKTEKYQQVPLKLPPDLIKWLAENTTNRNGFIVEAIREKISGKHHD